MQFTITEGQAKDAIAYGITLFNEFELGGSESISISGTVEYDDNYRRNYEINATFEWKEDEYEFYDKQTDKVYDVQGLAMLMARISGLDFDID